MSNILIVNGAGYSGPFTRLAEEIGLRITCDKSLILKNPEKVSLIVFTGGADISSDLYKEVQHSSTRNSPRRDDEEMVIFYAAKKAGIPMAGICRGSQFLCAMAGGKVIQDVTGHVGNHIIAVTMPDETIKEIEVTSTHHQMQYPFSMPSENYKVIGWTLGQLSRHYIMNPNKVVLANDADINLKSEPDIVWYPKIKALATQYHPEFMSDTSEGYKLYLELLDVYIKPEIMKNEQNRKSVAQAAG